MFLQITSLTKTYGAEPVLRDINLSLGQGHILSILGRSGCGKTTLLKILAGIEDPDTGHITLGGAPVTHLPPQRRNIVYLYQEPLLFPHLNVRENIAFGLRLRHAPAARVESEVRHLLDSLGLADHADKRPDQLSGGQRQRVSFARALIIKPALLLLDEPFSSLDPETRASLQDIFLRAARQFAITALFVTHDLKEALLIGDQLAILDTGHLTTYETKAHFIADPRTGVQNEITFWQSITPQHS